MIFTHLGNHEMRLLKAKRKALKELNGFYQETCKQLNKLTGNTLTTPKFIYEHSLETLFVLEDFAQTNLAFSRSRDDHNGTSNNKNGLPERYLWIQIQTLGQLLGRRYLCCLRAHSKNENFQKRNTSVSTQAASMGENSLPTQSKKTDSFLLRQSVLTAKRFLGIEYLLNHYGRHCHRSWHSHNQHE